jgi:hypothetical protein
MRTPSPISVLPWLNGEKERSYERVNTLTLEKRASTVMGKSYDCVLKIYDCTTVMQEGQD